MKLRRLFPVALAATALLVPAADATFPGANGKVAGTCVRIHDPAPHDLCVVNPDGSGLVDITNTPDLNEGLPVWAPAGTRKLAYPAGDDVYVSSPSGACRVNVTDHPADDYGPSWSPDGRELVFVSDRGGDTNLYVVRADGTGLRLLTGNRADDVEPMWSPDGSMVAYLRGRLRSLWVIRADGTHARKVAAGAVGPPRWSPDGARIAFSRNSDIYSVQPDGSGLTPLANDPEPEHSPRWSPDGTMIAYERGVSDEGVFTIFVARADGSQAKRFAGRFATPDQEIGDWSPDSTAVTYSDPPGVVVAYLDGGRDVLPLNSFIGPVHHDWQALAPGSRGDCSIGG